MHRHFHQTLTLIQAGDPVLDLDEVKAQLKIETDDDDTLIESFMASAQAALDGRDGILGRALLTQKWSLTREAFTHHFWAVAPYGSPYGAYGYGHHAFDPLHWRRRQEIKIPLPPLKSVDSVTYLDPTGAQQTLDPSAWRVVAGGGMESAIIPVRGGRWPATAIEPDAVTINFTCGYDSVEALIAERKTIVQWMLLVVALWYENREAALVADRAAAVALPFTDQLLASHRLHVFGT